MTHHPETETQVFNHVQREDVKMHGDIEIRIGDRYLVTIGLAVIRNKAVVSVKQWYYDTLNRHEMNNGITLSLEQWDELLPRLESAIAEVVPVEQYPGNSESLVRLECVRDKRSALIEVCLWERCGDECRPTGEAAKFLPRVWSAVIPAVQRAVAKGREREVEVARELQALIAAKGGDDKCIE